MGLPAAMLFDLDDTLLNDTGNMVRCWRMACQHYADQLEPHTPESVYAAIREYSQWYWSDADRHREGRLELRQSRRVVVAEVLRRLGLDPLPLAEQIADLNSTLRDEMMAPFPGALETLEQLRQQGIHLALVTNGASDPQRMKIARFGLEPFFEMILIEGEFGAGKPDERVYRHTLSRLGVQPSQAWMTGDNLEWDVAAPQRLGMYGIWCNVDGTGLPTGSPVKPDRIIRSVTELLETG